MFTSSFLDWAGSPGDSCRSLLHFLMSVSCLAVRPNRARAPATQGRSGVNPEGRPTHTSLEGPGSRNGRRSPIDPRYRSSVMVSTARSRAFGGTGVPASGMPARAVRALQPQTRRGNEILAASDRLLSLQPGPGLLIRIRATGATLPVARKGMGHAPEANRFGGNGGRYRVDLTPAGARLPARRSGAARRRSAIPG